MTLKEARFRSQGVGALADAQLALVRSIPLRGRTFTDIGGYDGTIAACALDAGASSATVVDNGEWKQYAWPEPERDGRVTYVDGDLMTWRERADVVAAFNILYHLEDPIGGLRRLRAMTDERLLCCTSFVQGPAHTWRLYDLADPGERIPPGGTTYTVYFKPTISGLVRALERVGFVLVGDPVITGDHVLVVCK
jgi:hypothetical protein